MTTTNKGDKIGIPMPTPGSGGSDDVWGTELNDTTAVLLDEIAYAAREDRNLTIEGGGKITWDESNSQVTFTDSILIRNHITNSTVTITTAASPVSMPGNGYIAYVQINRKPSSNQTITSITSVAAGSLPNGTTDADMGTIVLFMRTDEFKIFFPKTSREIMKDDFWTFGSALSHFERKASAFKPQYYPQTTDLSKMIVPATSVRQAVVLIDGKIYFNESNKVLDLDTSGRNGLDTGTKAADTFYYLYAIPGTGTRDFDLVCSATGPITGDPTGFTSWSYLGAFLTNSSSDINKARRIDNWWIANDDDQNFATIATNITSSTYASTVINLPETSDIVKIRIKVDKATTTNVENQIDVSLDGSTLLNQFFVIDAGGLDDQRFDFDFPLEFSEATIHYRWAASAPSGWDFDVQLVGFHENVMEYK
jgi:hypothetical protein